MTLYTYDIQGAGRDCLNDLFKFGLVLTTELDSLTSVQAQQIVSALYPNSQQIQVHRCEIVERQHRDVWPVNPQTAHPTKPQTQ